MGTPKDLLTVLGEYNIEIKKEGSVLRALCPLHKDTHKPNFTIYPDDKGGSWFCFACSIGGNAAFFISKMEGIPYSEALLRITGEATLDDLKEKIDGLNIKDVPILNAEINITVSRICYKKLRQNPSLKPAIFDFLQGLDDTLASRAITSVKEMQEILKKASAIGV